MSQGGASASGTPIMKKRSEENGKTVASSMPRDWNWSTF